MITTLVYSGIDTAYNHIFPDTLLKISNNKSISTDFKDSKESSNFENRTQDFSKYNNIYKKNLFGTLISKVEKKPDIDISNLEETRLNLKLLGTVVGFKKNYAVILMENKQGLYVENDKVKDAVIKRIFRQKVVLTRNNKDEILVIEPDKGQKNEYYNSLEESINQSGENQFKITRQFIDDSLKDINSLMRQARVKPHFKNGKPDGIKIDSIRPFSLFKKMGLKNGDVLIGANGNKIKTVNDAIGLYNNLRSADRVTIQIKRSGIEETLDYNIEE